MKKLLSALTFFVLVSQGAMAEMMGDGKKHVLLFGASVGHAWNIENLPERVHLNGVRFEYVGEYDFDKGKALQAILNREEGKPDAIILKECAAYFPRDLETAKRQIKEWIGWIRAKGIVPVPATVVPVTRPHVFTKSFLKYLAKEYMGMAPGPLDDRLSAIAAFNDWLKAYAEQEGLTVLDLEAALRVSERDRRLRPDLAAPDGLHLNARAYEILDGLAGPTLATAFRNAQK